MPGKDVFLAVIDLSLALIGFSSIVTALRRSKDKSWSQQEINGLIFLAGMAIGAILFCLLPFALYYMEMDEHQIFTTGAGVYLSFSILVILAFIVRVRRSGFPSRRPQLFRVFSTLSAVPIIMMGLIVFGQISRGLLGFYLLGVFWLLILAFIQFLTFLSFVGFAQDGHPDQLDL